METDLHAVIQKGGLLKDIHKSYILYQLLKATKFIHSGNVIHRDQKPSNVLLDAECSVKLCDFGLARSLAQLREDQDNPALTDYVATRWYRAPEILLSSPRYTKGVDMWSLGCILGELLLGKPLFPGTSTVNQLEQILRVIPAPSPEDLQALHSDYGASVVARLTSRRRVTFEEILPPSAPPPALDLLKKLLVFDPGKRLSAEEALQHPYVRRFHCPAQEPSLGHDVVLPLGDDVQLPVAQYRNQLYQMILDKKSRDHPKEQVQRENIPLGQAEPEPPVPAPSSHTSPDRKGPREPTPPLPKPSHVPAGTSTSVQPGAATQDEDLARTFCQKAKINMVYNPITHTAVQSDAHPGAVTRTCSAALHQQAGISNSRKVGTQLPWGNPRVPPSDGQNLCSNPRNPHFPSKDVRPLLKSSKKMFQITANVGAAGDPRASMGSYSQAYGTICKSALQSLPIPRSSQHQ
ncbi:mitogen-activated protein kinase 15 isoform X2 [Apus apus]|nr:mitogen-activated protein kinase 15 isoform X2 [Apus apus]